jgi:hypothetical protein
MRLLKFNWATWLKQFFRNLLKKYLIYSKTKKVLFAHFFQFLSNKSFLTLFKTLISLGLVKQNSDYHD